MKEHEASRTLVKSPPELWAECSDAASLARHLDRFGEIRITKLEPEREVAWEGEQASGTVRLEPSGWGTRVCISSVSGKEPRDWGQPARGARDRGQPPRAPRDRGRAASEPDDGGQPAPALVPALRRRSGGGLVGQLLSLVGVRGRAFLPAPSLARALAPAMASARRPPPPPRSPALPEPPVFVDAKAALSAALDSLGQAHHRPFSRS